MGRVSRRHFVTTSAGLAAAAGLGSRRAAAANEKIGLGFIGCGGRGQQLLRIFKEFPDVDIRALSDVNSYQTNRSAKMLTEGDHTHAPVVTEDYRPMLERKDIDAVVIATTQHWHGLPFIHACQAGKHVFVEKPLSHTVAEGRAMVDWAKKTGVIAMMGTQQRAGEHYKKAVAKIHNGELGKIALVECWNYHHPRTRAGRADDREPPDYLNWERWLGPAARVPFNPARIGGNAWFFAYGGGMMTNWAVHHIDIILWAMRVRHPSIVWHGGGKFVIDDMSDTPDTTQATWEFPGWTMQYIYRGFCNFHKVLPRPHHHGIAFYGDKATMVLDRSGYEIWPDGQPGKSIEKQPETPQDGPWQRTFIDCVKEGRPSPVDIEDSHRATVCCHLANVSYKVGRRSIAWDGERERIPGDPEAAALLSLPRREGYELPEL